MILESQCEYSILLSTFSMPTVMELMKFYNLVWPQLWSQLANWQIPMWSRQTCFFFIWLAVICSLRKIKKSLKCDEVDFSPKDHSWIRILNAVCTYKISWIFNVSILWVSMTTIVEHNVAEPIDSLLSFENTKVLI